MNRLYALIVCFLVSGQLAYANSASDEKSTEFRRAQFHYQMFCMGCHSPDGTGHSSVPNLQDSMNYFMRFPEGRQFMVQVPGSANSVLSDAHLAELLNWMASEFSQHIFDSDWSAYSVDEVAEYRKTPLLQTDQLRAELLKRNSTK